MKNKVINNIAWIVGGNVIQMIMQLIVGMMVARYLGPTNYGIINTGLSYVSLFAAISGLGLSGIIVNELVKRPKENNTVLGTAIVLQAISGFLCCISCILMVYLLNPDKQLYWYVVTLQALVLPLYSFKSINFWFQKQLKSKNSSIAQVNAYMITSVYKIVLIVLKAHLLWFAAVSTIEYCIVAFFLYRLYCKEGGEKLGVDFALGKKMISQSKYFIFAELMSVLFSQADKIMLEKMVDATAVGYYSAALTMSTMWGVIPIAITDSLRPIIMKSWKDQDSHGFERHLRQLFAGIFYLGCCYSIGVSIFSKLIITILYGKSFLPAQPILLVIVWYSVCAYIGNGRSIYLICTGKNKYAIHFAVCGFFVNVALNFLLIPIWGAIGAGVATLSTYLTTVVLAPLLIKDTRRYCRILREAVFLRDTISREELKMIFAKGKSILKK